MKLCKSDTHFGSSYRSGLVHRGLALAGDGYSCGEFGGNTAGARYNICKLVAPLTRRSCQWSERVCTYVWRVEDYKWETLNSYPKLPLGEQAIKFIRKRKNIPHGAP
jgi:hypothetical protein